MRAGLNGPIGPNVTRFAEVASPLRNGRVPESDNAKEKAGKNAAAIRSTVPDGTTGRRGHIVPFRVGHLD